MTFLISACELNPVIVYRVDVFSALTLLVGQQKGIRPIKTEWWGAGMVICLEQGADFHMTQLMPLSLASVKSRLALSFWYQLNRVVPEKRAVKWVYSI